ncbi:hypothetical protein PGTUg99_030945 [Puccinia graminis f. sp. tritici]|uniref:Uncharacterized protein n=1 Tax=Puccinia graminis f. sp. tritici TaxID=56615 RepID=A0A5B0S736_PUCGR|nr:hypothetical protein PGTUg99_030945 [Puccinia graminis f. sp. tritici]
MYFSSNPYHFLNVDTGQSMLTHVPLSVFCAGYVNISPNLEGTCVKFVLTCGSESDPANVKKSDQSLDQMGACDAKKNYETEVTFPVTTSYLLGFTLRDVRVVPKTPLLFMRLTQSS